MAVKQAYRPLVLVGAVFLGVSAMVALSNRQRPELVKWEGDVPAARERAKREGKPVLLYFTAEWCGPCQLMKGTTFADAGVAELLHTKFVPVRLDIDASETNRAFAVAHRVESFPCFVVIDGDGQAVRRNDAGYMDAAEFMKWLQG